MFSPNSITTFTLSFRRLFFLYNLLSEMKRLRREVSLSDLPAHSLLFGKSVSSSSLQDVNFITSFTSPLFHLLLLPLLRFCYYFIHLQFSFNVLFLWVMDASRVSTYTRTSRSTQTQTLFSRLFICHQSVYSNNWYKRKQIVEDSFIRFKSAQITSNHHLHSLHHFLSPASQQYQKRRKQALFSIVVVIRCFIYLIARHDEWNIQKIDAVFRSVWHVSYLLFVKVHSGI